MSTPAGRATVAAAVSSLSGRQLYPAPGALLVVALIFFELRPRRGHR
jgi:hypothetical protein